MSSNSTNNLMMCPLSWAVSNGASNCYACPWLTGLRLREYIERIFGEGEEGHGLRRCRYVGLARYAVQAYLTAMVVSLKRMVRWLTGLALKDESKLSLRPA